MSSTIDDNYKDHLMRYCQSNNLELPVYSIGSHENGIFGINVYVGGVRLGYGFSNKYTVHDQVFNTDEGGELSDFYQVTLGISLIRF